MQILSGSILVIGSINMDVICRTPTLPQAGQTVLGEDLRYMPGGKGANQAVAAARLGSDVNLVGRVGTDEFGETLLAGLKRSGVNTRHVHRTPRVPSGCAMIMVDRRGENAIAVSPGANARVTPADVDAAMPLISGAAAVVLQLEIPLPTVRHAISLCRRLGKFTILDPAPVPMEKLSKMFFQVDVLTPNEVEARALLGRRAQNIGNSPRKLAAALLEKGPGAVVLKLGAQGAIRLEEGEAAEHVKAFEVDCIDSTGAGDAFTGALSAGHAQFASLEDSVRFANAAGALCCTKAGAQPAMPNLREVVRLMKSQ